MERRETDAALPAYDLDKSPEELLHQDHYTPEELAALVGIGPHTVRRAARDGELRAAIVGEDIISIRRADALEWLRRRG